MDGERSGKQRSGDGNKKVMKVSLAVAAVAAVAIAAILLLGKPYMKPIDKMFKAYNSNDLSLLQEAMHPDLYDYWNKDAVEKTDFDITYETVSVKHLEDDDAAAAEAEYGAEDAYEVTVSYTYFDESLGGEETAENMFLVCKTDGKWIICGIY